MNDNEPPYDVEPVEHWYWNSIAIEAWERTRALVFTDGWHVAFSGFIIVAIGIGVVYFRSGPQEGIASMQTVANGLIAGTVGWAVIWLFYMLRIPTQRAAEMKRQLSESVPKEQFKAVESDRDELRRNLEGEIATLRQQLSKERPYLSVAHCREDRPDRWLICFTNKGVTPARNVELRFGLSLTGLSQDFRLNPSSESGMDRLCSEEQMSYAFSPVGDQNKGTRAILYVRVEYGTDNDQCEQFSEEHLFSHVIGEREFSLATDAEKAIFLPLANSWPNDRDPTMQQTNLPSTTIFVLSQPPSQA